MISLLFGAITLRGIQTQSNGHQTAHVRVLKDRFERESNGYRVVVTTSAKITSGRNRPWRGWGSLGKSDQVISDIELTRRGKELWVPVSCYADLANVTHLNLVSKGASCTVTISGGDAGESYTARIILRDGFARSRVVRSGEFPEYHFEKTEYVNKLPTG